MSLTSSSLSMSMNVIKARLAEPHECGNTQIDVYKESNTVQAMICIKCGKDLR